MDLNSKYAFAALLVPLVVSCSKNDSSAPTEYTPKISTSLLATHAGDIAISSVTKPDEVGSYIDAQFFHGRAIGESTYPVEDKKAIFTSDVSPLSFSGAALVSNDNPKTMIYGVNVNCDAQTLAQATAKYPKLEITEVLKKERPIFDVDYICVQGSIDMSVIENLSGKVIEFFAANITTDDSSRTNFNIWAGQLILHGENYVSSASPPRETDRGFGRLIAVNANFFRGAGHLHLLSYGLDEVGYNSPKEKK